MDVRRTLARIWSIKRYWLVPALVFVAAVAGVVYLTAGPAEQPFFYPDF